MNNRTAFVIPYRLKWHFFHPFWTVSWFFGELKSFVTRGLHGWAPGDSYSLCSYMQHWMPAALDEMINRKCGIPAELYPEGDQSEKNDEIGWARWEGLLKAMKDGFLAHNELDAAEAPNPGTPEYEALEKRAKDGLAVFSKYFGHLWY